MADAARLDIKASGLWGGRYEQGFFDIRVFNPCASLNQTSKPIVAYRRHENQKRNNYDQLVREVEMASFTPPVFSAAGGMGPAATATVRRIASRLAEKMVSAIPKCHVLAALPLWFCPDQNKCYVPEDPANATRVLQDQIWPLRQDTFQTNYSR